MAANSSSMSSQRHQTSARRLGVQRTPQQHDTNYESTAWRSSQSIPCRSRFSIFTFLVVFVSLLSVVSATADPLQAPAQRRQPFADLGARRLMERAAAAETTTESSPSSTTTSSTTAIASATTTVLPQPFDTTLGNNFTNDACPKFFVDFLSDATFQACYPFSLLLQTSHGFFEAEKNFYQTTAAVQAGCEVDFDTCNNLMQGLAAELKSQTACLTDFQAENQIVMQAYNGLVAYPVMYQAACLKDTAGDYCFANAVTLRDNASLADAYSYYLPLGTTMPVGTRPSCSDCLKRTMAIYRSYASNTTQPVSGTYVSAAQQVNMACGPEWVSDVVQTASGASPRLQASGVLLSLLITLSITLY